MTNTTHVLSCFRLLDFYNPLIQFLLTRNGLFYYFPIFQNFLNFRWNFWFFKKRRIFLRNYLLNFWTNFKGNIIRLSKSRLKIFEIICRLSSVTSGFNHFRFLKSENAEKAFCWDLLWNINYAIVKYKLRLTVWKSRLGCYRLAIILDRPVWAQLIW